MLSVSSEDDALIAGLCETAERIKAKLEDCALEQISPITISVLPNPPFALESCLARYKCEEERIEIAAPEKLRSVLLPDSPYAKIPVEDLFDSLIAHEMAHAFFSQMGCVEDECFADQEFVAYAMQFALLPRESRRKVVDAFPDMGPVDPAEFNPFILYAAPVRFGVRAWSYFSAPGNGCALVQRIVDREESFFAPPL